MGYIRELRMFKARSYWNWEIKGVDKEDIEGRVNLCNECLEELKSIKDYYESFIGEVKDAEDNNG